MMSQEDFNESTNVPLNQVCIQMYITALILYQSLFIHIFSDYTHTHINTCTGKTAKEKMLSSLLYKLQTLLLYEKM